MQLIICQIRFLQSCCISSLPLQLVFVFFDEDALINRWWEEASTEIWPEKWNGAERGGRKAQVNDWRHTHTQTPQASPFKQTSGTSDICEKKSCFSAVQYSWKERVSERTTGTSPQLHFCPFQHQNRMISVADVKVWQSEELIRDWYADLLPIRHRGRALCLIAALYRLLCTLEQTARRYRGAEI